MQKKIADAALTLVSTYAWEVFPLRQGTNASYLKATQSISGRPWGASRNAEEVERVFTKWPRANIGLPTGSANDLLVVDIDSLTGHDADGFASLKQLEAEHGALPETLQATTPGGGRHFYFHKPVHVHIQSSASKLAPGIDIKCEGGMVVCPPSARKGKAYAWVDANVPIAPAPTWLIEALRSPAPSRSLLPDYMRNNRPPPDEAEIAAAVQAIANPPEWGWAEWNKIGLAIYAATDGAGFELFDEFSRKWIGYDAHKTEKRWQAYTRSPPDRLTAGSLFYHADLSDPDWRRVYAAQRGVADLVWPTAGDLPESHLLEDEPPKDDEPINKPVGLGRVELTDFWAYLENHTFIYEPTGALWPSRSIDSLFGKLPALNDRGEPRLDKDGEKVLMSASTWFDQHRPIHQIVWAPEEEQIIGERHLVDGGWIPKQGARAFNTYRPPNPPACGPQSNDPEPWLRHLRTLYPNDWQHLLAWFAHHVQRPGNKVNHSVVLLGAPGIGKDMLLQPLVEAVGPWNFRETSPHDILSAYSGYAQSVILRINEARDLGDTATRFQFYERTKTLMASPPNALMINEKYIKHRTVVNACGVIITTNNPDSLYLPEGDRRHYVAHTDVIRSSWPENYFAELQAYYDQGGYAAVRAFLLNHDLSAFNAKAPPPETETFWEIVENSKPAEIEEAQAAAAILGTPPALTVKQLTDVCGDKPALTSFADWLYDKKNNRRIPVVLDQAGYIRIRNPHTDDGRWFVAGTKTVIYGRKSLKATERLRAAQDLSSGVVVPFKRPAPTGRP